MYIYIYLYIFIFICIHIRVYIYIYIHVYVCVNVIIYPQAPAARGGDAPPVCTSLVWMVCCKYRV